MKKLLNTYGFASMVEVVVSSIFFILVAFGVFTCISMIRPQGSDSAKKLEAAYIGQSVLEQLRTSIDASTWHLGTSPLRTGEVMTQTIVGTYGTYTVNYELTAVGGSDARHLLMNVIYPN